MKVRELKAALAGMSDNAAVCVSVSSTDVKGVQMTSFVNYAARLEHVYSNSEGDDVLVTAFEANTLMIHVGEG